VRRLSKFTRHQFIKQTKIGEGIANYDVTGLTIDGNITV
jgi:hypothetical protein